MFIFLFTWRNQLGYPAHTGLIGESVRPIRLRLCSTNIVIDKTAPQTQKQCHINHIIIIVFMTSENYVSCEICMYESFQSTYLH